MKKQKWVLFTSLAALFMASFSVVSIPLEAQEHHESNVQMSTLSEKESTSSGSLEQLAYSLGVQAYIYGYPLVVTKQTEDMMLQTRAPINHFYFAQTLASPEFKDIVTPNSNTLYFTAWLDLFNGPVVLHVPENKSGRYYTVQMLDVYTNTFHNVSNRSTHDKQGQYAIVGPDWKGKISGQRVNAPTPSVWLIGRVEVDGEEDLSPAVAFEKQFTLTAPQKTEVPQLAQTGNKTDNPFNHPLSFFQIMTEQIQQNPPPPCDNVLLDQFKLIGIDMQKGFDANTLPAATIVGLTRAAQDAQRIIEKATTNLPTVNGWLIGYGIGTYGNQFLLRAIVAYSGLGANIPEEELYARTFVDGSGQPLNGANPYVLHFNKNQIPQVYGFWALTLYGPDFYLIPNLIKRYAIGNLTKGLTYNQDGSLDLYIQQKPPAPGKESNWLPAPAGDFNLVLRMFAPKPTMLKERYEVPPVIQMNQRKQ
ncbi:DUF1254 domain-containing protein [Paenibacillus sp. N3.4]|uniref:DUF1254 domain-containing protein n=1 Tax=Paenibacillus sp. N3.4 TaxID=2603222 RepID=UPI0011C93C26|nr:DUF1254 domain-containing protein [Paenibacillus sp. N3.4]TXK86134.1 DUF1254 domain-containing protein [Paenibacillus sp. N3.4]